MRPGRRQVLKGVGVGLALGAFGTPTTAGSTDRVFVHPAAGVGDLLEVISAVGGRTVFEYDNFDFVAAEIPSAARDVLGSDPRVAFLEDDDETGIPSGWAPSLPNLLDPGGEADCSLHPGQRPSWGYERIGAAEVDGFDGTGVDVAILDTGIESDHCDLSVVGGRNFSGDGLPGDYEDHHGHGTHVAGVVAALDNDIGVVGVAPEVNLYAVKVLGDDGSGSQSALVAGIDWCLSNGIELVSMSLGSDTGTASLDEAIETAHAAGHLLVSAAGNRGNEGDGRCGEENVLYPARHPDVLAVSAMGENDTFASYSSVGPQVDCMGPGSRITSTYVDNEYARASGTSVACPFVTGVAALCWHRSEAGGPGPNDAVRSLLEETAEPVLGTCEEGSGLVDARGAVDESRDPVGEDAEADDGTDRNGDGSQDTTDERPQGQDGTPSWSPQFDDDFVVSLFDRLTNLLAELLERLGRLIRSG